MDVSTGKDKENMQSSQPKQELEGGATQQDATSSTQPQTLNPNQVQTALQNLNEPQAARNATTPVVLGKVRTLTFERPQNNVFRGYVAPMTNKNNQIQVLLKKNSGEEMVNMTTIYGNDGSKSEQSFRKTQEANLHAQQFIKLVEKDGYFLITDVVEDYVIPVSPTTSDISSIPQLIDDTDFLAPFDHKDPFVHLQAMTFQEPL
ncbi:hypothetical protein Tco_1475272 [Tanacetum coccineum]